MITKGVGMAKPKKLNICALNVVIHEKEKRDYKRLFNDAAALLRVVAFNQTHAASLIWTSEETSARQNPHFSSLNI
jgi:hypothetical protein